MKTGRILHERHYTPGPEDRQNGLWVESAGHYRRRDHVRRRRMRDDFLLCYCIAGEGHYRVEQQRHPIASGDFFISYPHTPHAYACGPEGWEILWMHCAGPLAETQLALCGFTPQHLVATVGLVPTLQERFAAVYEALAPGQRQSDLSVLEAAFGLLVQLREARRATIPNISRLEAAAREDAENLEAMARHAGMSKFHFVREFQRAFGVSPWRYAMARRINRAKLLLGNPELSIKEIAYETGFRRVDYFSRLFRRETGISASEYRQRMMG